MNIKYINGGYLVGDNIEKFNRIKKGIADDWKKNGKNKPRNGDVAAILMRCGFEYTAKIYDVDLSDLL